MAELKYGEELVDICNHDPLVGEFAKGRLVHYSTVTREPFERTGRITDLMTSGKMFEDLGVPPINPETDRAMLCGSMAMINDTKKILENFGLEEGSNARPSTFVVERAFVD